MLISQLRRTAAVAAVAGASLTFFSLPAGAQACYPPTADCVTTTTNVVSAGLGLSLSSTTVGRSQTIAASVTGGDPGTTGILTIASVEQQIGTFTMPASGAATTSVTIPSDIALGAHTVFARGTVAGQPASASQGITVVAAGSVLSTGGSSSSTSGGSNLARTGIVVVPTFLVGVGLVLGGLALKRSSKRKGVSAS